MKDRVLKLNGKSNNIKIDMEGITTFDDFKAAAVAGTLQGDVIANNDGTGTEEVGTALSKANLLTDPTAALYGLDAEATIDDLIQAVKSELNERRKFEVGDISHSKRNSFSGRIDDGEYLECLGQPVAIADYPDLEGEVPSMVGLDYKTTTSGVILQTLAKKEGVIFGAYNGRSATLSGVWKSADNGETWGRVWYQNENLVMLEAANGRLLAFPTLTSYDSYAAYSDDGVTWVEFTPTTGMPYDNLFIVDVTRLYWIETSNRYLRYSDDNGITLSNTVSYSSNYTLNSIIKNPSGSGYIATARSYIVQMATPLSTFYERNAINSDMTFQGIATDGTILVAYMTTNSSKTLTLPLRYSLDYGATWLISGSISGSWEKCEYVNGVFLAYETNTAKYYESTDGATWEESAITTFYYPIAEGNDGRMFVDGPPGSVVSYSDPALLLPNLPDHYIKVKDGEIL